MKSLLFAVVCAIAGCAADSGPDAVPTDMTDALRAQGSGWYAGTASVSMVVGLVNYLARVDGADMTCPDGSVSDLCIIDDFDVSSAHLDPAYPVPNPLDGTVLYLGSPDKVNGDDVLRARQVWGQGIDPRLQSGMDLQPDVALIHDSGIACVTDPCDAYDEKVLSNGTSGPLAELDFSSSGATQAEIDDALAAAGGPDGLVVEGPLYQVVGPDGVSVGRTVLRFWIRVPKQ